MKYPNKIDGFLDSDFFKNTALDSIEINDPGTLVNSPVFCDFVYSRIYLESIQLKNGRYESNKNSIFNNIIQNYTGEVKEKLLVLFFYRNRSYGTMDYLDKALDVVTKPEYRNILSRLEKTSSKGVLFFPFELEDSQGKIVALKDFKNKIIILDFWYTGCGNCIILNNAMKPVVEKFKNNPNVQFISVSVDKDKSKWLQSLSEGKYTHPESINLYAGVDKMRRHPLVNAYNISAYPRLFVIKNEKMYEATPPDARMDKGVKMIKLIDAALQNKTN
jgi:thiol-disulfide isomerase/thioredoxin